MRKLLIVTLGATIAAMSFAPVAQAKHRMMKKAAMAPMMMAPMNPRVSPNGDFYATPVNAGDAMGMMSPLGVPGAVVGGVTQPLAAGVDGLGVLVPTP